MTKTRVGIGIAIALLVLGGCGQPPTRTAPQNEPPAFEPPPQLLVDQMVRRMEGEYVGKAEVYGVGATDREGWKEAEPGFAMSYKITDKNKDDPIYAVFFKGDLKFVASSTPGTGGIIETPPVGRPEEDFVGGRVVFDSEGNDIAVSLWDEPKSANPPFGAHLDDR